jgi:adenylosuccinate lyase
MDNNQYSNPLISRYASAEMSQIWSSNKKFGTWRRLWLALATAEQQLGLNIKDSQLAQMQSFLQDINYEVAVEYEKKLRHDVMAHVHAFGDQCPDARAIIHLGATSCFVTDNTDLILIRESLQLVARRLAHVILQLAEFSSEYRELACLAFTHLQPAQPTTVGKRACLWNLDFVDDLKTIEFRLNHLKARGAKGTTGTQASFLTLFDGDHAKVVELDRLIAEQMGFKETYEVTGQTYSRKLDSQVLDALSNIAQSAHKMATDVRILAHRKEMEEPFEPDQIGSSAMAYKRNPMRCERICSLARFVISLQSSPANTLATQWMERTLDDSANRRLVLPQAFLAIDAILILLENITVGMVVYPKVVERNLAAELPFMSTETILMAAVSAGGDRQTLHEKIRQYSQEAAQQVKTLGLENDLLDRLAQDADFQKLDLAALTDPRHFVGRAPEQVDEFVAKVIGPIKSAYADKVPKRGELKV